MTFTYTQKAHETVWNGTRFRSRLEARWASFFTKLGWQWEYEPVDLNGWVPDFVLVGKTQTIYVEVKPIIKFCAQTQIDMADTLKKMELASIENKSEAMLVGSRIYFDPLCSLTDSWIDGAPYIGLLGELDYNEPEPLFSDIMWQDAALVLNDVGYDFSVLGGSWQGRVTGFHDGNIHHVDPKSAKAIWNEAGNSVQWTPYGKAKAAPKGRFIQA